MHPPQERRRAMYRGPCPAVKGFVGDHGRGMRQRPFHRLESGAMQTQKVVGRVFRVGPETYVLDETLRGDDAEGVLHPAGHRPLVVPGVIYIQGHLRLADPEGAFGRFPAMPFEKLNFF